MRRLFLLRHAKSSRDDPALSDGERPLAKCGESDAPSIAQRLRGHLDPPASIMTSPAERALRTAKLFADALGMPQESIAIAPALYLAEPAGYLHAAAHGSDAHESLMVVGHNPGLTDLVHRLLPSFPLDNLPTAGLVVIDFPADVWAQVERTPARLVYYDYPKNPRAPLLA